MRHAWLDVSAGTSGDMLLGACLDAGADLDSVQAAVAAVVGPAVRITAERVDRAGQRATKAHVTVDGQDVPHRTWGSIRGELEAADLAEQTRVWALGAFGLLAEAEGATHGIDPEDVHFHEVGALDSIADVVGASEGLRLLGVGSVSAGAVALGDGRVRTAHGDIPVPVPAVARLALGWEVLAAPASGVVSPLGSSQQPDPVHAHHPGHHHHAAPHETPAQLITPGRAGELATPTGMALVRALAGRCEPMPSMTLTGLGVGAGGRDTPGRPNVVRILVGDVSGPSQTLTELSANVDDLDPRLWPGVIDAVLAAGAVDAWLVPILMKKGRPAHTLHALVPSERLDAVVDLVLTRTTTLGVRYAGVARTTLERTLVTVAVAGTPVQVKAGHRGGIIAHAAPEFDQVAALARRLGVGELEALTLAGAAAAAAGLVPGGRLPATVAADDAGPSAQ